MNNLPQDLELLKTLQLDLKILDRLEDQVEKLKDEYNSVYEKTKRLFPQKPVKKTALSDEYKKERKIVYDKIVEIENKKPIPIIIFVWIFCLIIRGIVKLVRVIRCARLYSKLKSIDKKIAEATRKEDAEHNVILEKHNKQVKEIIEKRKTEEAKERLEIETKIKETQEKIKDCKKRIEENRVLAKEDKNEKTINYVVNVIERKRAASLVEALKMYDEENQRIAAEIRKKKEAEEEQKRIWAKYEFEYQLQQQKRDLEAQKEINQIMRDWRVEEERRKQTKTMKEVLDKLNK